MTHTNSLVCSETVTEKWRVWVGCGKCVSGPEQYVKTYVLKCLLQSFQQPPSRSAAFCWTPDSGAYRLSPGACQSATLHYTAAFVVDEQKKESHNAGKRCVTRCAKVCACVQWQKQRRRYVCSVCPWKCILHFFSPAAKQFPLKMGSLWSKGPINPLVSPTPLTICLSSLPFNHCRFTIIAIAAFPFEILW